MNILAGISLKAKRIGIDLGTANIVVWMDGRGIINREPSIVARDISQGHIVAVGNEAFRLLNERPGYYVSSRPLKEGVIADYETTVALIKNIIKKSAKFSFQKPYLMICVPTGITEVEKRAVVDAALEAGAKDTFLVDEPYAAAIGAGLPISAPTGNFIVDIGGGTTNIALISLSGIVASRTIPFAGDKMDEAIRTYVEKKYGLQIGLRIAEMIKMKSGSADLKESVYYKKQEVKGRNCASGLPEKVTIAPQDISFAIQPVLHAIVEAVISVLEQVPPEIAADVITQGIVLTGGGALLHDIDKVIEKKTEIPTAVSADPLDCVVTGIGENLKRIKQLKKEQSTQ